MNDIERVEVPVTKVEVRITLDDIIEGLAEEARKQAEMTGGDAPPPETVERLRRISELAREISGEVREVHRISPTTIRRLEQGSGGPRPDREDS